MRWSERQLAMLREMGIRVWAPETRDGEGDATVVAERAPAATSAAPAIAGMPAATPRTAPPPIGGPVVAAPSVAAPSAAEASAAEPMAPGPLASAEWLVVVEPFAAAAADPSAVAEQELLLDNMLRAIRVARRAAGREGRASVLAIDANASAAVDAAIAAVEPRCILAFGRAAATALLGVDAPLGKLREQVHERSGIPVVVTFALPYLLRHAADKPRAWADLCRAVAAGSSPSPARGRGPG